MSKEKLKAGIFYDAQICKLIADPNFFVHMIDVKFAARSSYVAFIKNCSGNHKVENYVELVLCKLKNFFFHSHLRKFSENLVDLSGKQGERFHQEIKIMGEGYQERWDQHMMADYCWSPNMIA